MQGKARPGAHGGAEPRSGKILPFVRPSVATVHKNLANAIVITLYHLVCRLLRGMIWYGMPRNYRTR